MPQPNDPPNDPVVGRRWLRQASKNGPPPSARIKTPTSLETRVDLCVIGAGPGGLTVAAAAAQLGVAVVLVERHKMGGDCLNYGCIPSKALVAAGRRAQLMRSAAPFGIRPVEPAVDPAAVHAHVQRTVAAIAPNDSAERFAGLGVKVIRASAHFITRDTVLAGEQRIKARRFVIATGSSPLIPAIPGLDKVDYFTNETIFQNREKLDHLIVIGGGPSGLELAQAHLRLGSRVTVIEAGRPLGAADPELAELAIERLAAEGLDIRRNALVERVSGGTRLIDVHVAQDGKTTVLQGTHLLVAAGRKPNLSGLNLEAAGIKHDARGIRVNKGLATSNRRVLAIGDVTGGPQFTHVANYHAGIVIRRTLFRLPATVRDGIIPWVTFTDPELASVGLSEEAARRQGRIRIYRWPYYENDRAHTERSTAGLVKVVTDARGRVKGAGMVGEQAGELIQMWSLAVAQGLDIKAMTHWISPYPTLSEINKRAAFGYYAAAAASPFVRKTVGWLAKLG
ncbi:MAG TPA: FAD-dependent oxidoreductase [Hyphomicrobiaceae bacterium]|jgi:pyruvate/2-oxoglutarate dehydrogenase complex dihydrolipoamide dehydrogenase (E3) component